MQSSPVPTPNAKQIAAFWLKVYVPSEHDCLIWQGGHNTDGYGHFKIDRRTIMAHRMAYWCERGAWPAEGLVVDHLCRTRDCVNPKHLQAVTNKRNVNRGKNALKDACPKGHAYIPANVIVRERVNGNARVCRTCIAIYQRHYYFTKSKALRAAARKNGANA